MKNYSHYVIRVKKGKPNLSKVYWFIVILNKKKQKSQKIIERLGFYQFGKNVLLSINYKRLAYYLNKGVILNDSVKYFISLNCALKKY